MTIAKRVLIADAHPLFRLGVRHALETSATSTSREAPRAFQVLVEASSNSEALAKSLYHCPDIVLVDVRLPATARYADAYEEHSKDFEPCGTLHNGIDVCLALRERLPDTLVVMLTASLEPSLLQAAYDAGAHGLIAKNTKPSVLVGELQRILEQPSRNWLRHSLSLEQTRPQDNAPDLTPRERQVLYLLGEGRSNKQIARVLSLSPETIKVYLHSVYRKLNVNNRMAAVNHAQHIGLLCLESPWLSAHALNG